jgi:hypothetical protein
MDVTGIDVHIVSRAFLKEILIIGHGNLNVIKREIDEKRET